MPARLPPLNNLRTFEIAARHLSFTRAASELHITQAAVSNQIKSLETFFGVKLFKRLTRQVALTREGQTLLPVVRESFARLMSVSDEIRINLAEDELTVSLGPFFSAYWLAPRLNRFWLQHPQINLRLFHSNKPVDFAREEPELAVIWGRGDWPGVSCERLLGMRYTPVCSPDLLQRSVIEAPQDLAKTTLLHDADRDTWTLWLKEAGVDVALARQGAIIDDSNVLIQAAMDGQGVALCGLELIGAHLRSGKLVQPFDTSIRTDCDYYIIYPPGARQQASVAAFCDWLIAEAAA